MSRYRLGLLLLVVWIGGSGVARAAATASPTSVTIGNVAVGASGTGSTSLSATPNVSVTLELGTTADCPQFQILTGSSLNLNATGKTVTVQLTPASKGAKSCDVIVKDASTTTELLRFAATGTGIAPAITVSPSPFDFGGVRFASGTATKQFTISNTGDAGTTLSVTGITFSGTNSTDYSLNPPVTLPLTVSGTPKTVTVVFDPSAAGPSMASMDIANNDPAASTKSVTLTGTGTNATIGVTDVNFGTVNDGATGSQNIAVTNSSTSSPGVLTVISATITDTSGFFSFGTTQGCTGSTSCTFTQPFTVTSGSLSVPVRCQPPVAATGTKTATVTFVSDSDAGGDAIAQLTCTAGRPNIVVSTSTLGFGNVAVGSTSPAQTVTIMNTGTVTLTYSLSKTPNVTQYAITGCTSGCSIAAGGLATFTVTFTPTAIGLLTTRIDITNNDPDPGDSPFSIDVSGTGTAPQISVAPTSLTFANTEVGRTSTAQTVTATNTGNSSVTISSATFNTGGADYTVAGTTGSQTLLPAASTNWNIACKPSAQGARSGKFRIVSNSLTGSPTDLTLTCTGEQGVIATNPTSIDFGGVVAATTKTLPFTLQNTGNVAITGITGTLNNTTIGYQVDPATVPATLAAGASAALAVTFAPQSGTDGGPATITFTAGWGNFGSTTAATLSLNGDGLAAGYDITPSATFDFGNFRFDTRPQITYHIVNTGQPSVTILTQVFTPDAGTAISEIGIGIRKGGGAPLALPQTLATGEQLDVTVTAQPNNRIGLIGGHIDIHSDLVATATVTPDRRVTLTGTSSTAAITVPALVDFGPVDVDGPAPTQTLTLTNNGTATLDIASITELAGASPAFTVTLPGAVTHVLPGDNLSLTITYKPTVERPPNQFDTTVLVANNLTGIFGGPSQAMITLQGRGIDRHIIIDPVQDFPMTAVGLESGESTQAITVHNTGEATLRITALMFGGDPVWELVDPSPVDIPGNGSHDFLVKFTPTAAGSFSGELTLMNNDNDQPMATVTLTGSAEFAHVHGSGGCDAGGAGAGGGWALAFGVLVTGRSLRRWRRRRAGLGIAAFATVVIVAIAPPASADGIGVTVFEPTPATTSTGFQLQSPDVGENGSWVASSVLSYASHPLVLDLFDSGGVLVNHEALIERSSLLQVGGAYAFLGRFEAGAHMPFYMQSGQAVDPSKGFAVPPAKGTATGNLTLHAKARLWRGAGGLGTIVAGASAVAVLPTATKDQFTGSDKPAARLLLLGAFTPAALRSRVSVSANAGAIVRGKSAYADMVQQSGVAWGAGASVRVLDALWATAEMFGDFTPSGQLRQPSASAMPAATVLSQIEWLAGVSYKVDRRFTIGLAAGRGVTDGPGTPDLRGVLSLAFVPDASPIAPIHPYEPPRPDADEDGDGIIDRLDRCPHEPEDKDGFQDADGCPDPDNDHDGIPDALDRCPNEAEDKDGFQDVDGCPDPDNDGDGIPDALDKCPDQPETLNGFQDADGCPDTVDATSAAPPDQGSPTKAAEATFTRGRELMKQGNYAAACAEFEQSQRLDPEFGTQYNLAGCYEKTGKLATAWNLYRELARSDTNATRRAKAVGLAGSLAHRVPRLKLVLPKKPDGLQVSMNGANANALIGIEIPVDLGSYALVVGATGYRAWRKTVEITEESKVITVVIDLQPAP